MSTKVFIDGQAGTTGLQLEQRLKARDDIELLERGPALRQETAARLGLMEQADAIFLCLPDDEARLAAEMAPKGTLLIDASTAHRTAPGWAYGLPELSGAHYEAIRKAKRIAVPGCHAAGFVSLIYPLVANGLLPRDAKLCCTSLTGYSGGGRGMIATYEAGRAPGDKLHAPRPYALGLTHKHLPEMKAVCGLESPPIFMPVVGDMAQGMLVTVPLWPEQLNINGGAKEVWEALDAHYKAGNVHVRPFDLAAGTEGGFMDPTALNGTDEMQLFVFGHGEQILLAARLDNLGKGASGAAVQCLDIAIHN
jgi:N-acetyl-gamma-glutamyl-phosphate reductase